MKLKNKIALLLILLLALTTNVFAAEVEGKKQEVTTNDEVKFIINFDEKIITAKFEIQYDSSKLELIGSKDKKVKQNNVENGRELFVYSDEKGEGTKQIIIYFKAVGKTDETTIKLTNLLAYSSETQEEYALDTETTEMKIKIKATTEDQEDKEEKEQEPEKENEEEKKEDKVKEKEQKNPEKYPFTGNKIAVIFIITVIGTNLIIATIKYKKVGKISAIILVTTIALGINSKNIQAITTKSYNKIKNYENITIINLDKQHETITYNELLENIEIDSKVKNVIKNGKTLEANNIITTGTILQLENGKSNTVIIYGDVNKDGKINVIDIAKIIEHNIGKEKLDNISIKAANVENSNDQEDKELNEKDIERLENYLLEKIDDQLVKELPVEIKDSEEPKIPEEPTTPTEPENPNNPNKPENPKEPNEPNQPVAPETPEEPKEPETPTKPQIEISCVSTENSIKVEVTGKDLRNNSKYKYYICKAETNNEYKLEKETTEQNFTYTNLDSNTNYFIKVEYSDQEENKISKETSIKTKTINVTGIKLNNDNLSIKIGEKIQLQAAVLPENASIKTITWSSSNNGVATVKNGEITGLAEGVATIAATTLDGNKTALCQITVKKQYIPVTDITLNLNETSIYVGQSIKLTPTILPENASNKNITWLNSDSSIAKVSNGIVEAIKPGTAIISVTTQDQDKTAYCKINVLSNTIHVTEVTLNCSEKDLLVGDTYQLIKTIQPTNATNKNVTWISSNPQVATVSETGLVKAINNGETTIKVKTEDQKKSATCKIIVNTEVTGIVLDTEQLDLDTSNNNTATIKATILPSTASNKNIRWTSSDSNIARVTDQGLITAVNNGTAIIYASTHNGYQRKCIVNVTTGVSNISLNKASITLYAYTGSQNHEERLIATVSPSTASDKTISWKSDNPTIASVSNDGLVTAIKEGTTRVVATSNNGKNVSCTIKVLGLIKDSTNYNDMKNNSEYLQELIDKASEKAGTGSYASQSIVSIPSGKYYFVENGYKNASTKEEPYVIKCRNNVLVTGAGKYNTYLLPYGNYNNNLSGTDMFYYNDYSEYAIEGKTGRPYSPYGYYLYNADFRNFTIDGINTRGRSYTSAGKGFMINLFKNCDFDSVIVKNTDGTGFGMDCPVNCTIINCEAYNCGKAATENCGGGSGFGIGTGYANNESIRISNCYAELNKKYGFFFEHQGRFHYASNQPYRATGSGDFKVVNCTAAGNLFDFGGERSYDATYISCTSKNFNNYPAGRSRNKGAFHFENYSVRSKVTNCQTEQTFTDISSSDMAYKEIMWALQNGIVEGEGDWKFRDKNLSRAWAVELVWRAEGRPGNNVLHKECNLRTIENGREVLLNKAFNDIANDHTNIVAINWGANKGIINGVGDGKFAPEENCTRASFVVMLWRLAGSQRVSTTLPFTDVSSTDWYYDAVKWAYKNGITIGVGNNKFAPNSPCTKSQAIMMLYRYKK